jgi:hypothetical protein
MHVVVVDTDEAELASLLPYAGPDDGVLLAFKPVAGEEQLGVNRRGEPRIGRGLHFVPDRKGGGKLYTSAKPGARLVARVRRWP